MMDESSEFHAVVADWLAGLLANPISADAIAQYRNSEGRALLDALAAELPCREAIDRIRAFLVNAQSPQTVSLDLAVAYTRLFEGVKGSVDVSLYESAYMEDCLFGQATRDMSELLTRVGMSVREGCGEPPDHVSVELALFSIFLCKGDADGVSLLEACLSRWIPNFVVSCQSLDPNGFYGAVAAVLGALFGLPLSGTDANVSEALTM